MSGLVETLSGAAIDCLHNGEASVRIQHAAAAEIRSLRAGVAGMRAAAAPLIQFIEMCDAKPIGGIHDTFYSIHVGTEWEAELKRSDLRALAAALREGK